MALKKRDAANGAIGAVGGAAVARQAPRIARTMAQNRSLQNPLYRQLVGGQMRKAEALAENSPRGLATRATENAVRAAKGVVGRKIRQELRPSEALTPRVARAGEAVARRAPSIARRAIGRAIMPSVLDFVNVNAVAERAQNQGKRRKGPVA